MSRIAFICPIYDSRNHFEYGHNLANSLVKFSIDADLYFVFSSEEQRDKFETNGELEWKKRVKSIVLPLCERDYKSQVTIKKFYALRMLKDIYDFIYAIDSETLFIKHVDIEKESNFIWNKETFLNCNVSPDGFGIMRTCFKTLGLYDNKVLKKETENFMYNNWFNEIPIYKCEYLAGFFDWLDSNKYDGYKNEWYCFEYHIFTAYLLIKKHFHLHKFEYESLGGIMEYLYIFDENERRMIQNQFNTHWASAESCVDDTTFMLFHLDRDLNSEESYHIKDFSKHIKESKKKRCWLRMKDFLLGDRI